MSLVSARQVPSGYFRVHLYVLLGLGALAGLMGWQRPNDHAAVLGLVVAVVSYFGSVAWLYEASRLGKVALWSIAALAAVGARLSPGVSEINVLASPWSWFDPITGGLVLGSTMAAMLLGHWYLNTPTMQLAPLKKLIALMAVCTAARAVVCASGLGVALGHSAMSSSFVWFLVLRWAAGILGVGLVALMAWQTLKIPNTQSATGILYVGVIVSFIGELTSQLLSQQLGFPL